MAPILCSPRTFMVQAQSSIFSPPQKWSKTLPLMAQPMGIRKKKAMCTRILPMSTIHGLPISWKTQSAFFSCLLLRLWKATPVFSKEIIEFLALQIYQNHDVSVRIFTTFATEMKSWSLIDFNQRAISLVRNHYFCGIWNPWKCQVDIHIIHFG